jgi:hypothetical protein
MKLLSIQVGLPREVHWQGRTVTTGIFRQQLDKVNADHERNVI